MASSDFARMTPNHDPSKKAPDDAPSRSQYRFRPDLEIVDAGEAAVGGSHVTVLDTRSGESHIFTADEFLLCQAADGTHTLAAIRQAFHAGTGRDFPHGKLFAFFRRLRGLGLLEEDTVDKPGLAGVVVEEIRQETESYSDKRERRPVTTAEDRAATAPPEPSGKPGSPGMPRRLPGAGRVDTGSGWGPSRPAAAGNPGKPLEPADLRDRGVENFLAARAMRAWTRRDVEEGVAASKETARLALFNPNFVFGVLAALTWPLKYIFVPLLLMVPAATWVAYHQREILAQDMRTFDASVVGVLILSLVVANCISRLTQGTFIRGFGADVKQFGIVLAFGIPRFFIDLGGIATLGRRGQLWVHSGPLIARLVLFCAGTLVWFFLRQSAPSLSYLALVVSQIGLLAFLLSAWALLPSDGYRWLATYFGRPALRLESLRAVTGRFLGAAQPQEKATSGLSPVIFYVLDVSLVLSVLALVALAYIDIAQTGQVGLPTTVFLLVIAVAAAAWAVGLWNYGRNREIEALDPRATQELRVNWAGLADLASDRPASIATVGKVFWSVVLVALLAVAFLPYRYQAAGTFEILPGHRTVVTARTSGEIEEVLVREGDWVVANQVLAKLSSKDQQREIAIANTELQHAKAQLAQFGGDKQSGDAAKAQAESDLERSLANALNDEPDSADTKNDATATNYTRTQAERTARAEVERLTRKLANARDQLADTTVRAPTVGRVVTPNVQLSTGVFLRRGAELLTLDDTRTLEAEINLPETEVGLVKIGDTVRLRPWSLKDREIAGTVTEIAPTAQTKSYGTIVRVDASITNPAETLRPAMTGYAKIDSETVRVWQAFLGRIIRIVRVEMWSWIP
jgi:multidrug efflux pump subunit AcrA (membrane-fusion protein)